MALVSALLPEPSAEERQAALQRAASYALARGVTSVVDMGRALFADAGASWRDLEQVYEVAAAAGQLPLRVRAFVPLAQWGRLATKVAAQVGCRAGGALGPPGRRCAALGRRQRSRPGPSARRRLHAKQPRAAPPQGRGHSGGRLFWGGVKAFADGSLGSRTALMWQPYSDDGASSGTRTVDLAVLRERAAAADAAGLQVGRSRGSAGAQLRGLARACRRCSAAPMQAARSLAHLDAWPPLAQVAVHAIGDRAVDEVLEVLAELPSVAAAAAAAGAQRSGLNPLRHRIEHAQHISGPGAAQRLASSGVYAVPNPLHLLSDRHMMLARLGQERAAAGRAFAYRAMLEAGAPLAFGSDWPVVDLEPLAGVFAAVCRRGPGDGPEQGAWAAEEAVGVEEALRMHTADAARLAGLEGMVGVLRPGLRADLLVLSGSPVALDCARGGVPEVVQTYVDGGCVHGCG
jgi:predicted amidohydrolase YtcJ